MYITYFLSSAQLRTVLSIAKVWDPASLQKDLSCQIVYFPNNSRLEQTFWENNYGKETVPKARASGFGILDHSPRLVPVSLYVFTPHPRIPPPETRVFGTISNVFS